MVFRRFYPPPLCPFFLRLTSKEHDFFSFYLKWYALIFFFLKSISPFYSTFARNYTQLKDVIV